MEGFSSVNTADGEVGKAIHTWAWHPAVESGVDEAQGAVKCVE